MILVPSDNRWIIFVHPLRGSEKHTGPVHLWLGASSLLASLSQRRLQHPLQILSALLTITHEPLDQFPAAIKDKRLWNILIVAQVIIGQFVFGKPQRILNAKLRRICGN